MMHTIDATELRQRQEEGEELRIIDVREEWEYEEENIGAINIPLHSLPSRMVEIETWKNQEIIIHCQSGNRGVQAQKYLIRQGFTETRNLLGGMERYLAKVR